MAEPTIASGGEFEPFDVDNAPPSGLVLLRASRLENLVPQLVSLLKALPPAGVLEPHDIIAAHPGMRTWLYSALAEAYKTDGIAANLNVRLPSTWLADEAQRLLGQQAVHLPLYQSENLRWRILGVLAEWQTQGHGGERLARYLQPVGNEHAAAMALRRFQLADRLAQNFSQYMVYRPQWLAKWQDGVVSSATARVPESPWHSVESELLSPLWKDVHQSTGTHRGEVIARLSHALAKDDNAPSHPLHVFGVSHLAPGELQALKAASRKRVVVFHLADPCREYWLGMKGGLSAIRAELALARQREGTPADSHWDAEDHTLLAQWGRMGREFLFQLVEDETRVLTDVRDHEDTADARVENRLERLQESIRRADVDLLQSDNERIDDASMRIHACHTRLRELEVVKDAILDAIVASREDGKPLEPGDIAVIAPNIAAYSALIPAVFGPAADRNALLPYAISDHHGGAVPPLVQGFQAWLALPGSRMTANDVMALLEHPDVARRYGLSGDELEALRKWLHEARASWGLDAAHRAQFGVPVDNVRNTLQWAQDRLLASYVFGQRPDTAHVVSLPDGDIAPAGHVRGVSSRALGAFSDFLATLQALNELNDAAAMPAKVWASTLTELFEKTFRIDFSDESAEQAQTEILKAIRAPQSQQSVADAETPIRFEVVRTLLLESLEDIGGRHDFLRGGITFAGMVPQRAVPFRFIAVLGLNEGEFPRQPSDAGIDLMSKFRALGDRDVRSDDRWLFLETVMSARDRLHLSYIGMDARKGDALNPAVPLAELHSVLMAAWTKQNPRLTDKEREKPPWRVPHALQPFDGRYFNSEDDRLFSFAEDFAGMSATPVRADLQPLAQTGHAPLATDVNGEHALQALLAYWKDPAKHIVSSVLDANLEFLEEDAYETDEPLDAAFEPIDTIPWKVLLRDVIPTRAVPVTAPAWIAAEGYAPAGDAGHEAWLQTQQQVHEAWGQLSPLIQPGMVPSDVPIELDVDGIRLQGHVRHVFVDTDSGAMVLASMKTGDPGELKSDQDLDFKVQVPLFIQWAALRLSADDLAGPARQIDVRIASERTQPKKGRIEPIDERILAWETRYRAALPLQRRQMRTDLSSRLRQLIEWSAAARVAPAVYFPKTSFAAAKGKDFRKVWTGDSYSKGERNYSAAARLLGRNIAFEDGARETDALKERAKQLDALLALKEVDDVA